MILDAAAAVVPFVPGGVGTAIKAARTADKVADTSKAIRVADKASDPVAAVEAVSKVGKAINKADDAISTTSAASRIRRGKESQIVIINCGTPGLESKPVELVVPKGYRQVKGYYSHRQKVFTNGKDFITPDVDRHNVVGWKKAKTLDKLHSKQTRMGIFDEDLKWRHDR